MSRPLPPSERPSGARLDPAIERFVLGRPRPVYTPKAVQCRSCGAPQSVRDEHSQLVVCDSCGTHLALSGEELRVLGRGQKSPYLFPLKIGDSVRWDKARYEVIARMAFIEDEDPSELTREYYLYHPSRGTFWLSEYQGHWSWSASAHVKPKVDPFSARRGAVIETWDNRRWVVEGAGVYKLAYVDGALPWIARIGDTTEYVDLVDQAGKGLEFEASHHGREVEFSIGEVLSPERVREITARADLAGHASAPVTAAGVRSFVWTVGIAAALGLFFQGALALYAQGAGQTVLRESLSPDKTSSQVLSSPFQLGKGDHVVQVDLSALGLNNEWMAVDLALVKGEDSVVHVFDSDMEYYHGTEGGESWHEGKRSTSTYFRVPDGGEYRLLVHAVTGQGESTSSEQAMHPVAIEVIDGARVPWWAWGGAGLIGVILVLTLVGFNRWRTEEDDDD